MLRFRNDLFLLGTKNGVTPWRNEYFWSDVEINQNKFWAYRNL